MSFFVLSSSSFSFGIGKENLCNSQSAISGKFNCKKKFDCGHFGVKEF